MRTAVVVLAVAVMLALGALAPVPRQPASQPATLAPTAPPAARQAPDTASLDVGCDPGYRCGTCPNGDTWAYLDDGSPAAVWGQDSTLIFDTHDPCG